ncbi:MAG: N-acyl-L-homoserine lactone synthetase [Sulfitobacter sp.]
MTAEKRISQYSKAQRVFPELAQPDLPAVMHEVLPYSGRTSVRSRLDDGPVVVDGHIRSSTISIHNLHLHGELFTNYLRARHETFIVGRGWKLPEVDGMEFDQYDTPLSRCVVLHEYGEILAGIRLTPTTARCGAYTYMIRDAQLGLLPDIPQDLLFMEAPVKDHIWEATRLFVSHHVSAERRHRVQTILMQQMALSAQELGISHIIGIVPSVFQRWMKRIGMSAFPVGPTLEIEGDRTQAAMMRVGVRSN